MIVVLSLLLLAAGAILTFATSWQVNDVDLDVVGIILMIVGGLGLLWGLFQMLSARERTGTAVVERRDLD